MSLQDYAERNREAWNQAVPLHQQGRRGDLRAEVRLPSFNVLGEVEKRILSRITVRGKKIAHLCCNNGIELISMLKMGAVHGVGFDIADAVIQEARELSELAGTDCEFVRTNVLDISEAYWGDFDLVFISIGALTWIRDLKPFFRVAANLLQADGHLVIYEMHPFTDMMGMEGEEGFDPDDKLKIVSSYFRTEPWVESGGLDYIGGTAYEGAVAYSFPHTLSDTFTAIIESGLVIVEFQEYAHDISATFAYLEKYGKIPLCYSLVAQKASFAFGY